MDAVLPIHPEHAERILNGSKTMEFRRRRLTRLEPGSRFVLYATAPISAVVGTVRISRIVEDTPARIIAHAAAHGDVRAGRSDYLRGERAVCYHLEDPIPFKRSIPARKAPFSFSRQGPTYVSARFERGTEEEWFS